MFTSDISPQNLLKYLPKIRERSVEVNQLIDALGLSKSQASDLRALLAQLVKAGLAGSNNGRYWRTQAPGLVIGRLRGTRSGHAFVIPDDPREREKGDLRVSPQAMGEALHEDIVAARVIRSSTRGREGRVEAVLRRANKTVVGTLFKLRTECVVSPIDERFLYEIRVGASETGGAGDGEVVNVEITRPPIAGRLPSGRVIEVLAGC